MSAIPWRAADRLPGRAMSDDVTSASKFLSYVLRHDPDTSPGT
jgi:RNA:NAD 2'-phosphotransferase (TPT1/KptA family)